MVNLNRRIRLKIDLPFLKKGSQFWLEDSTGLIYPILDGKISEYFLRPGLAGYIWMLMTEKKYVKILESTYD